MELSDKIVELMERLVLAQEKQNDILKEHSDKLSAVLKELRNNANKSASYKHSAFEHEENNALRNTDMSAVINAKRQELMNKINKSMAFQMDDLDISKDG